MSLSVSQFSAEAQQNGWGEISLSGAWPLIGQSACILTSDWLGEAGREATLTIVI